MRRRKYKYTAYQETDAVFMFFDKMKKNNELDFNNCGTQNPEDVGRKNLM